MSITVAKLMAEIGVDASQAMAGLKDFSGRMQSIGSSMEGVGLRMTAGITAPLMLMGKNMVDTSKDFEENMNMLKAVSGASEAQLGDLRRMAVALGFDLSLPATSASDAAEAMLEMSKAGLSVENIMTGVKGVLQMSAAGNLGNAQAAEIASNALNMFGLQGGETIRIADLLAAAANKSSGEIVDFAEGVRSGGAVFAAAGIPIEDMIAMLGVLANSGIKGEQAGTQLRRMFIDMQAPTKAARAALEKLGVSVFDASGNLIDGREIIGRFSDALKGLSGEEQAKAIQEIFGVWGGIGAQILTDKGVAAFDDMKAAVTEAGAAAALAASRMKGLPGAMQALTNAAETTGLVLGDRMNPGIRDAARFVADIVIGFSNLDPNMQDAIIKFGLVALAAGPVILIAGQLAGAIGVLVGVLGSPFGLAAAAAIGTIALLAVAFGDKQVVWDTAKDTFGELWDIIKDGLQPGDVDKIMKVFADLETEFGNWARRIDWQKVVDGFNEKLIQMTKDFTRWASETKVFEEAGTRIGTLIGAGLKDAVLLGAMDIGSWFSKGGFQAALDIPGTMAKISADVAGGLAIGFVEGLTGIDISGDVSKWIVDSIKRALMMANPATIALQAIQDALKNLSYIDLVQGMVNMPTTTGLSVYDYKHGGLEVAGGRAAGGAVAPYKSYLVGERGPEVLKMGALGGAIIPNGQMGGGEMRAMMKQMDDLTREIRNMIRSQGRIGDAMERARANRDLASALGQLRR